MHLTALLLCLALTTETPTPCWPGFLGAGRSELAPDSLPLSWKPDAPNVWSCPLRGYGQSSPIVWGDQAYLTSVDGPMKDHLVVTAVSLKSGEKVWQKEIATSDPVENGTFVSRAAPTPVTDRDGVYCFFESGDVIAFDHQGNLRWKLSLSQKFGKFSNEYGLAASPVQTPKHVVILVDHQGPSYVVALEKATGGIVWRTERKSRVSWTSPVTIDVQGKKQLLCSSAGTIDGYDLETGKLLWSHEPVGGNRICSPWCFGDNLFLIGSQTSREFPDENSVKQSNFAMRLNANGEQWKPEIVWRTTEASPSMASPMTHQGQAYWINRTGVLFCFEALTGEKHFAERIKQGPWATPLGVGDRIYLFGKDGHTTVIAAGREFRVLAESDLWDPASVKPDQSIIERETEPRRRAGAAMHATPEVYGIAAVPGLLLARTGDRLWGVRLESKRPTR